MVIELEKQAMFYGNISHGISSNNLAVRANIFCRFRLWRANESLELFVSNFIQT
jgi:hypothetical protein